MPLFVHGMLPESLTSAHESQIIRNGGGRVTTDVLRSLLITQDLLECNTILVIHHNDCGAQARTPRFCVARLPVWSTQDQPIDPA